VQAADITVGAWIASTLKNRKLLFRPLPLNSLFLKDEEAKEHEMVKAVADRA